jgi:hypothetical protein
VSRAAAALGALLLLLALAACQEFQGGSACQGDADCPPGEICRDSTSQCVASVTSAPALEVSPPVNNQGWVKQEFASPRLGSDGRLRLRLAASVSLQGTVYPTGPDTSPIRASITAWRDSLLAGRPRVQVQTSARGKDGYVLWLNRGLKYTFYVVPEAPDDQKYPPQVVSGVVLNGHSRRDFVLDGPNRAVEIQGRVLDAAGNPLPHNKVAGLAQVQENKLSGSVRVRAFESAGLNQSTITVTNPTDGRFSFKIPASDRVPATGRVYTIRVETAAGGLPVPTVDCKDMLLGIFLGTDPVQTVGTLKLPSFLLPKKFTWKIRGRDGSLYGAPVVGARVSFSFAYEKLPPSEEYQHCSARFSQTALSDHNGEVEVLLVPGSVKENQEYTVTVASPPSSPYASRLIPSMEVGPGGGIPASIFLEKRLVMEGTVVAADGGPVSRASIVAHGIQLSTGSAGLPVPVTSTTSTSQGKFKLYLETGSYNISILPPAGARQPGKILRVVPIETDLLGVNLQLGAGKLLSGTVSTPGGAPLKDASVTVYGLAKTTETSSRAVPLAKDVSGGQGQFDLFLE